MTTEAFKENILGKIVPMLEEASAAFATTPTMRSPASSKVWSTRPMGSSPEKICAPALR